MGWKITNEVTYSQREMRAILHGLNEKLQRAIKAPDGWQRREKEFELRMLQHDINLAICHVLRDEKIKDDMRRDYITKKDVQSLFEAPMYDISLEQQKEFKNKPDIYCVSPFPEDWENTQQGWAKG